LGACIARLSGHMGPPPPAPVSACATGRYIRGDLGQDGIDDRSTAGVQPRCRSARTPPGVRLNLWRHPPKPSPKPLGPRFWTVRGGESFGSIAANTGINIVTLEQLNPQLKAATLQPGDRVRLRL